MRRLLPVLMAVALMVPGAAYAADAAKKATKKASKKVVKARYVDSDKCQGDKDVPAPKLGKEYVYLNTGLNSVALKKDEVHTLKHQVVYYLPDGSYHRGTPGTKNGQALIPGFKHGDTWHSLSYDANGVMVVDNAAVAPADVAPATDMGAPAPVKEKKAKKAKKSKKGKKAKKAKTEAAPKADEKKADEAPKADEKKADEKKEEKKEEKK